MREEIENKVFDDTEVYVENLMLKEVETWLIECCV